MRSAWYDVQPFNQALPRVLADVLRQSPNSPAKIDFAWKAAVGPAVGRVTAVRLEGTTLLVESSTPAWTREFDRSSRILLHRIQALLGPNVVTEILIRA